jgi:hypothetical protein
VSALNAVDLSGLIDGLRTLTAAVFHNLVPSAHALIGAAGVAGTVALYGALGMTVPKNSGPPECRMVAGWGLICLVLTLWGVATAMPLYWPLAGLIVLGVVLSARRGMALDPTAGAGRIMALMLALWLVVLPILPSQHDTWGNLLPNAAYLYDHEFFPTTTRPTIYSFIPVAPYNTQFSAYIASVLTGGFADTAMGLFHVALQSAMALLLARVIAYGAEAQATQPPPWWACAAALLLTFPLNPGCVPRIFFSSYGEAPTAVTTAFAAWLGAKVIRGLAQGEKWPTASIPLALVLCALVNIKQSTVGQFLALGVTMLILAALHPRFPRIRGAAIIGAALTPAGLLYLAWRWFASSSFPVGELKLLPLAEWNLDLIPEILWGMLRSMLWVPHYLVVTLAFMIMAVRRMRRDPWGFDGLLIATILGIVIGVTGFLAFTYVAHFSPDEARDAHSFSRYASQLSLAIMLGLVVVFRSHAIAWVARLNALNRRRITRGMVLACLVLPFLFIVGVRFDLLPPQPEVRMMERDLASHLKSDDKIALLLPREVEDHAGALLRGLLLFSPPRHPRLDFRMEAKADAETLSAVAAAGYNLAFISCTPPGLEGIPARSSVLLQKTETGWEVLDRWSYAAERQNLLFDRGLAPGFLCAEPGSTPQ